MFIFMDMDNTFKNIGTNPFDIRNVRLNITSFKNESDCDKITSVIREYYDNHTYFNLIIETKDLNPQNISIQWLYTFSSFLNSQKNNKCQYLKKTYIKIYDNYCYELLYFMFTYLSSPIAIVEVILYKNHKNCEQQASKDTTLSNIEKIKQYFP